MLLRRTSIDHLKRVIGSEYGLGTEETVKGLAVFHVPHFTEPLLTSKDVRLCAQNRAWILWSGREHSYGFSP